MGKGTTYEALRRLASPHRMDLESYLRELAVNASDPAIERAIRLSPIRVSFRELLSGF
jgi:hypothetical protein